jgi:hypothetical protein
MRRDMTGGVCLFIAVLFLLAWAAALLLFRALWNWLVPELFHGPAITFWQAFGLCLLISFITGGIRASSSRRGSA